MGRVFLVLFVLAVTVYAATDCINAHEEDRRGLPTGLWLILIIMLPIFGPVSWFVISSGQRRARMAAGGSAMPPRPERPTSGGPAPRPRRDRPVAPDDDPEFLWRLEQEQRRAAREERERGAQDPEQKKPDAPDEGSSSDESEPDGPK